MLLNPALADEGEEYTIGVVPQFDSRKILAIWRPILDEVEQQTGIRLRLQGSPSIPRFEKEFQAGKFDFVYMNPYHMLVAHNSSGYQPLLRDHGRQLHGILVVRKDSPVNALSDLEGKVVAFPAPNALGASLMMRADLQGERQINIEPTYVKSHTSVYLNVVTGMAVAGGGVQKTLSQQPVEISEQLRVLYRTAKVAPHPLAVHPRVPAGVAQRVLQAILAMGQSEGGKVMLGKIPMKQVGVAALDDYKPLEKLGLEPFYVK
jgi:phosphonate transport system substrate-binding protein